MKDCHSDDDDWDDIYDKRSCADDDGDDGCDGYDCGEADDNDGDGDGDVDDGAGDVDDGDDGDVDDYTSLTWISHVRVSPPTLSQLGLLWSLLRTHFMSWFCCCCCCC